MTFFTTPELLEIGDIPFSSPNQKPTRQEALEYYRKVAEHYQLDVRQYEPVQKIEGSDNNFVVHTTDLHGRNRAYQARKLILATGYYDRPNLHERSGRRPSQGAALLPRAASLLQSRCAGRGRQEFRGHRGAGVLASRRARDAGASAGRDQQAR